MTDPAVLEVEALRRELSLFWCGADSGWCPRFVATAAEPLPTALLALIGMAVAPVNANEMIQIVDRFYDPRQTGGPTFEQYLRNARLLVMDNERPDGTLRGAPPLFEDRDFREALLRTCRNPYVVWCGGSSPGRSYSPPRRPTNRPCSPRRPSVKRPIAFAFMTWPPTIGSLLHDRRSQTSKPDLASRRHGDLESGANNANAWCSNVPLGSRKGEEEKLYLKQPCLAPCSQ